MFISVLRKSQSWSSTLVELASERWGKHCAAITIADSAEGHRRRIRNPRKGAGACLGNRGLLGHARIESTVRYLDIEVDDALKMTKQTEV